MSANKKMAVVYGIIGCGYSFQKHAAAISQAPDSNLKAVFDVDEKRARKAALRYGCESKPTLDAIFGDPDIKALIICTPHDTHKNLVIRTIESGKYAICEKPLALSAKDCELILKSPHYRNNVMTVFQVRFDPAIQFLFQLVRSKSFGKIRLCGVSVKKYRDAAYFKHSWKKSLKRHGGLLFNQGIHALDLMLQICGKPKKCYGVAKRIRKFKEMEDTYFGVVEFEGGALGNIEVTTYAKNKDLGNSVFVIGDKGSIKIGGSHFDKIESVRLECDAKNEKKMVPDLRRDNHARFILAVNNYILAKRCHASLPFAEDGARAVEFVERLYESTDLR